MTTHSVRNDEESVLGCNTETVFIVLSLESDVGEPCSSEVHVLPRARGCGPSFLLAFE